MNKYFSKRAKELTPYVPGEQPKIDNLIKLNTNENPYPPSENVFIAINDAVKYLVKYPKPECEPLREAIAQVEGLPSIDYVYVGNGSDEILAFCFQAFFQEDKQVLFPDITYSFYPVYCKLYGLSYTNISLNDKLEIDIDDYGVDNGGIIFANPNAPTGHLLGLSQIEQLLKANTESVVIIDEAYIDFGGQTCVPLIEKYPNLVVTRTLSKSHSLAGLRSGYVMAQPSLIEGVIRVKNSFNSYTADTLAQAGATAAILDTDYKNDMCKKVVETREGFKKELINLGFTMPDSMSNFVFVKHNKLDAKYIMDELRKRSILVRHFTKPDKIKQYLRISIGNDEDMKKVVTEIKNIVLNS